MSRSSHPAGTSPPRSCGKHRCNRKRLDRLPLSARTDELLPRVLGYYTRLCALPRRTRRALVRQWRRSLSAIALLLALGQAPALAATIDVAPGIPPAINADGICALIEAIDNANADAQTHADCAAGNGADRIVLPTGSTQSLTAVDNSTLGPTGLPLITSTVTIRGRNSTIRRESGAPAFRILAVASSGDLTLHRTTVSGGQIGVRYLRGGGDGVFNSGTLTLTHSTVSGNGSSYGGGVFNGGTATLTNSTVSDNGGYYLGSGYGGMYNSGTATLTHSTVSGNSGGGIFNRGTATLTLTDSTVSGNVSQYNGGITNSGTLTLTNSTVSGNSSYYCGHCGGSGGITNSGTLTLTNSTVSGNSGLSFAGGIANYGTLTLARTLISGNTHLSISPPQPPSIEVGNAGSVIANNHNLFGHDGDAGVAGFSPGLTDIVPNDPLSAILKPLADNGGPTKTHALPVGSPAIDASPDDADCAATDQRGMPRPQGPACDIGAFEAESGLVLFRRFAAELEIDLGGRGTNNDAFELSSFITLGPQSDGLDPNHETFLLEVGPATITLPAGALRQTKDGRFRFRGRSLEGAVVKATLQRRSAKRFEIHIEARRVEFGRARNPVPVSLTIGDDMGTALVNAEFD